MLESCLVLFTMFTDFDLSRVINHRPQLEQSGCGTFFYLFYRFFYYSRHDTNTKIAFKQRTKKGANLNKYNISQCRKAITEPFIMYSNLC